MTACHFGLLPFPTLKRHSPARNLGGKFLTWSSRSARWLNANCSATVAILQKIGQWQLYRNSGHA